MRKVLFCVLPSLFFYSCNSSKTEGAQCIETLFVSTNDFSADIKLSEIATAVNYISLETSDSVLIGNVVRIIQQGDYVYVADKLKIYQYDKKGVLKAVLSNSGLGPAEYTNISDFQVDSAGNLFVLCRNDRCLYKYNITNGLQQKINLNCWVSNIYLADDRAMFLYVGNEVEGSNIKQLHKLDLLTEEIAVSFLDIDSKKSKYLHVKSDNYFSSIDKGCCQYFYQPVNDTIYKLSPDLGICPAFYINISNNNIPSSFFNSEYTDVMDFFQNIAANSYAYGASLFAEYPTSYLFSYYKLGQCYMAILPKQDHANNEQEGRSRVFNNIHDDVNLFGYPISLNDVKIFMQKSGEVILTLTPSEIFEYTRESLNEEQKELLNKMFKNTGDDQNPILLSIQFV